MSRRGSERSGTAEDEDGTDGVAVLLTAVGADVGRRFAALVRPLGLEPRHAAILRAVAADAALSQLRLSAHLDVQPSRMVVLLDELEAKGLIERRVSPADRRVRTIELTKAGRLVLARLKAIGAEHEHLVCEPLTAGQRTQLLGLLQVLARSSAPV
jgi:DNA-binding MarR family transcriptional regulator